MDNLLKDIAFGFRTLRKSPGFTVTALITLALGIGASTAIFSVVNSVLLRPLPYASADRLVLVNSEMRNRKVKDFPFPPADLKDLRDQVTSLDQLAGLVTFRQSISENGGQPEQVSTAFVTENLVSTLGARIELGRDFNSEDVVPLPTPPAGPQAANAPPPPPVDVSILLTHDFWQRRFGGERSAIGRVFDLGPNRAHIVGVLAPGFEVLMPPRFHQERRPDMLLASRIDLATGSRINVIWFLIGRLRPGATVGQAQAQVDAVATALRKRFPIKETAGVYYQVTPLRAEIASDVKPALLSLMGAVLFVLLIACANVANLILVRTSRRERELAVRAAFGGSRGRLVRQMLAEALVLSTGGALLGLGVAELGVTALTAIGPKDLPHIGDVTLDANVLGFTVIAALAAASLFGIIPALRASRPNLMGILRQAGRSSELGGGKYLRNGVVMAEVALAFVLLIGGGLMFRSFLALTSTDPGFDPRGVLTFSVQNARAQTVDARAVYQRTLHDRLAAIPGVTAVTAVTPLPLDGQVANVRWGTEAAVRDPAAFRQANAHIVLPGYFAAMKTPILGGRDFNETDNALTSQNVIVDSLFAASVWPGEDAVGKRIYMRYRADTAEWVNVIGVARHQRHESLAQEGRMALFIPDGQFGHGFAGNWVVRGTGDPASLTAAVRKAVADVDPLTPIAQLRPMSSYVDQARAGTRFALVLIGAFAAIAVLLSGVGLYGVLSTVVRQRTAEIGVRMALGAPKGGIFQLVIGQGMRLSLVGIAIGFVASLALTRVLRSLLVGVAPTDPVTFFAVALLFFVIAVLACWLPARRAAGLDPSLALRDE